MLYSMDSITYKQCKVFFPPIKEGKVIKVYDGDTITIATQMPYDDNFYRFSVRIRGIDCPEIKSKDSNEKLCAIMARDFLKEIIFNKVAKLEEISYDKYGRILADVYVDDLNISELMISESLAVKYDGGRKKEIDWFEYYKEKHSDYTSSNSPYKRLKDMSY